MSRMVRKIDDLYRIVLPKAAVQAFGWQPRCSVNIEIVEGGGFLLTRGQEACGICGAATPAVIPVGVGYLCPDCLEKAHKTPAE